MKLVVQISYSDCSCIMRVSELVSLWFHRLFSFIILFKDVYQTREYMKLLSFLKCRWLSIFYLLLLQKLSPEDILLVVTSRVELLIQRLDVNV